MRNSKLGIEILIFLKYFKLQYCSQLKVSSFKILVPKTFSVLAEILSLRWSRISQDIGSGTNGIRATEPQSEAEIQMDTVSQNNLHHVEHR